MSDLVTTNYDYASLAAAMGFGSATDQPQNSLAKLTLNRDAEMELDEVDEETGENKVIALKLGAFSVWVDKKRVFANGPVKLRVYAKRMQYRNYDGTTRKYKAISILSNMGEEPYDSAGGVACGKIRGKAAKGELSLAQQAHQKAVKAANVIFATVSFKGKTAFGEDVDVTDLPVEMRLQGKNFGLNQGEIEDFFKQTKASNVMPVMVELTVKPKRVKTEGVPQFALEYTWDMSKRLPVTPEVLELSKTFLEHIKVHNDGIMAQHKAALKSNTQAGPDDDSDSGLEADFGEDD